MPQKQVEKYLRFVCLFFSTEMLEKHLLWYPLMVFTLQEHGAHSFSSVTALETQLSHFYPLRGPLALGREDVLESDPHNSFGSTHILATVAVPLFVAPFPAPHVAIP